MILTKENIDTEQHLGCFGTLKTKLNKAYVHYRFLL